MSKIITIKNAQLLAIEKSGLCLSKSYKNAKTKLEWMCKNNHIWLASYDSILQGTWCKICHYKNISEKLKYNFDKIRKMVSLRGGVLLTNEYTNASTKLKIKCFCGNIWITTYRSLSVNKWCSHCAIIGRTKYDIGQMQQIATSRGGQCLSTIYVSTSKKLKWMCSQKHIWTATPMKIMKGRWCPQCSSSYGEKITRICLEKLFKKAFPKVKPQWLKNRSGRLLELDGYCESLNIAFEYQGPQHYKIIKFYKMDEKALKKIKTRDQVKVQKCSENGVLLLVIKGAEASRYYKIEDYINKVIENIIDECNKNGFVFSLSDIVIYPEDIYL